MKKLTPINGQVLIRDIKPEEKTSGGILMPDTVQQHNNNAIVVETSKADSELSPGDRVVYNKAVAEVELDGVTHRLVPEDEILCVLG